MTQQEFNEMLAVAIAGGLGGGTYISRWDGEEIDNGVARMMSPGGITTDDLADGSVTTPKLADGAVTGPKLAPKAVEMANLGDDVVDAIGHGGGGSGDNIARNAYFIGGGSQQGGGQFPINQRGETTYTGTGYTIDGWKIYSGSCTIYADGVDFTGHFAQEWENGESLAGREITVSMLMSDNRLIVATGIFPQKGGVTNLSPSEPMTMLQFKYNADHNFNPAILIAKLDTDSSHFQSIKVEDGDHQTLAHQDADGNWVINDPPLNYTLELMKCRKYYVRSLEVLICTRAKTFNQGLVNVQFPVPMRIKPAVTIRSASDTDGVLGDFASGADTAVSAAVNGSYLTTEGFNALIPGSELDPNGVYIFKYEASADL